MGSGNFEKLHFVNLMAQLLKMLFPHTVVFHIKFVWVQWCFFHTPNAHSIFLHNRSRWVFKTSPQNPNHEFSLALERVSAKSLWKKNRITTGPVVNSWFSAGNLEREKYHEIIIESSMLTGVFNLHHPPQAVPSNARRSFCTIVHRRCAKHYGVLWGSGLLIALKRPGWCECDKVCLSCKTNLINDLGATWHSSATRERMPMCAATRRIGILWRRAAHVSCCANSRPPW